MTYDSDRGRVVLFGGWDVTGAVSDVWEWEGANGRASIPSRPRSCT